MKFLSVLTAIVLLFAGNAYANDTTDLNVLKQELQTLEQRAMPNQNKIAFGHTLQPGDNSEQVAVLRRAFGVSEGTKFDQTLKTRVIAFQKSHNLEPSGLVGPATVWALNDSNEDRIRYLRATIAKREYFTPEERYILVNIPEYHLYLVENGEIVFDSNVIVGKSGTGKSGGASPEIDSRIVAMLYNPAWHPTQNISMRKLLPKWQKDPQFIEKHHLVVLDSDTGARVTIGSHEFQRGGYKFYQPPGENNALGSLRFTLINSKNIYLHDTNERELFVHTQRDFSSGCIRVQNWLDLATILSGQDSAKIQNKIDTHHTFSESIPSIPVHLVYWTAIVKDGKVEYVYDIYNRDKNY